MRPEAKAQIYSVNEDLPANQGRLNPNLSINAETPNRYQIMTDPFFLQTSTIFADWYFFPYSFLTHAKKRCQHNHDNLIIKTYLNLDIAEYCMIWIQSKHAISLWCHLLFLPHVLVLLPRDLNAASLPTTNYQNSWLLQPTSLSPSLPSNSTQIWSGISFSPPTSP